MHNSNTRDRSAGYGAFTLCFGSASKDGFSLDIHCDNGTPYIYLMAWDAPYGSVNDPRVNTRVTVDSFANSSIVDDLRALANFIEKEVGTRTYPVDAGKVSVGTKAPSVSIDYSRSEVKPNDPPAEVDLEKALIEAADAGWEEDGDEYVCSSCGRSVFCDGQPKGWLMETRIHEAEVAYVCNDCQFIAKRTKKS